MAPEGSPALVPLKTICRQTLRKYSLNLTTWSSFGVPMTFVQLSRAFAKRQAISKTKVMAMPPALGEKGPGGYWDEPRSGPRSETVRVYWLWPRLVGDSEANGVWNSVGRTGLDLSRSEPWMKTASGRTLTVSVCRSVLASVGRSLGRKQRREVGRFLL